jgi:hypothetical protein
MKEIMLYVAHHNMQVFSAEGYKGYACNENCNLNLNVMQTYNHLFV